jgi:hypothetical protein
MLSGMIAPAILAVALVAACGAAQPQRLSPAGSDRDDGYGELAQASVQLWIDSDGGGLPAWHRRDAREGGGAYGGAVYGDDFDDVDDAAARSPLRCTAAGARCRRDGAPHAPRYRPTAGLTGVIEGTVTWRGAPPRQLATPCGTITNPGVRVGADRGAAGVLVYIEHVEIGRVLAGYLGAGSVGGKLAKRGCALSPTLQILTPLPAELVIQGDATPAHLRVVQPSGSQPVELQQAGRVVLAAQPGVTRVEAEDGSLAASWIIASNTPYYALTDDRGRFRIDELAAGRYDVTVLRPPAATTVDGKLVYGAPIATHRMIKVAASRPSRLDVALDR